MKKMPIYTMFLQSVQLHAHVDAAIMSFSVGRMHIGSDARRKKRSKTAQTGFYDQYYAHTDA